MSRTHLNFKDKGNNNYDTPFKWRTCNKTQPIGAVLCRPIFVFCIRFNFFRFDSLTDFFTFHRMQSDDCM